MFTSISSFCGEGKENHSIASKLENTLLVSRTSLPYYMLVAFEAGGPLRALILLLISPNLLLLESIWLDNLALRIMIFISMGGLKVTDVKTVGRTVLPRFYLEDVRLSAYKVFSSCGGKKYAVTSSPRIMVEAFLRDYLNVDYVIGTELRVLGGYCLGLVVPSGLMVGISQLEGLREVRGDDNLIDVGLGNAHNDHCFMLLCQERYIVPVEHKASSLPRKHYPKPLIFHDGRLVAKPTPLDSLAIFLWSPMGVILAISRLLVGKFLPYKLGLIVAAATGMSIKANLPPISHTCETHTPYSRCTCKSCDPGTHGTLYVCSHRTLIDPVIVATVLQRPVMAVTYSVSRISELLSPIRTIRLSRDRVKDGEMMRRLLKQGDLVVCPEGTTCREPYLLRFSPLFSEIGDVIVPVAVSAKASMFHGTTVTGYKWLDSFFFLMNPYPEYRLQFLEKLLGVHVSASMGKSSYDIANHVQNMIGNVLGFECTNLTRRDKYRMLAGTDGASPMS